MGKFAEYENVDGVAVSKALKTVEDWTPGEAFIGRLLETRLHVFPKKGQRPESVRKAYLFDTDDGRQESVLGAATDNGVQFTLRHVYKIIFKGKKDIKDGGKMNVFDIYDLSPNEPGELDTITVPSNDDTKTPTVTDTKKK